MPAVRSAAGPINVPACAAPISMGTPSRAMRGLLTSGPDMRPLRVGWAKRACPPFKMLLDRWWARRKGRLCHPANELRRVVPLRLEIGDLRRGREQASARRPQFAVPVAIALVKDFGVSDAEHAGDIFGGEIIGIDVEI